MSIFLSCDWGTSAFRLRLIEKEDRRVLSEIKSAPGIAETFQRWIASGKSAHERVSFYKKILAEAITVLKEPVDVNTPVIISGMVTASIGMMELPYQNFPFTWDPAQFIVKQVQPDKILSHPLILISGFRKEDDVMRGEETLLYGFDKGDLDEGMVIFPGTHSKHVFIKNKIAQDFRTFMTGEIFQLLSEKSILKNAVEYGHGLAGFNEGFHAGAGGNFLHEIFLVRTRRLLQNTDPVNNYQYLSGLLIGAELRELKNTDFPVTLVCGEHLKNAYKQGLEILRPGQVMREVNADDLLIRGHSRMAEYFL